MREPSDELRFGDEGLDFCAALQAEVKADWTAYMFKRTRSARQVRNIPLGDTLRGSAVSPNEESP